MIDVGKIAFDLIVSLLMDVIKQNTGISELNFLEKRKIERRVDDTTAEIIEPLLPFLSNEGISQERQVRLIETCVRGAAAVHPPTGADGYFLVRGPESARQ